MMAVVCGVIAASIFLGSILKVPGSISTNTGLMPFHSRECAVATKEYGEVIAAMLQEQGFPVTLNVMEVAAWNERLYDRPGGGPGHMVDCGWSTGSPEPDLVLRTHFHSSSKRICGITTETVEVQRSCKSKIGAASAMMPLPV